MPHPQHTLDESRRIEQLAATRTDVAPVLGEVGTPFVPPPSIPAPKPEATPPAAPPVAPPPPPPPVVGTSASVRKDLTDRGVTDTDKFQIGSDKAFADFKAQVAPGTTKPEAPDFRDVFAKIRSEQGIVALEDEEIGLDAEKEELLAALREFKGDLLKTGVSQRTFVGRVSEEERGIQERLDAIGRRQRIVQMKIRNKSAFISDFMKFTEKDFDIARDEYEFEFNKNLQTQTAYQQYKNAQQAEENRIRDDARATWNTYMNVLVNNDIPYDDFIAQSPGFVAKINEIELAADMELGSFEAFARQLPGAKPIATVTGQDANGNKTVSFIYRGVNGEPGIIDTRTLTGVAGTTKKAPEALSSTQRGRLAAAGVPEDIADNITQLLLAGVELDEIRDILKETGNDPTLLDKYDRAVGIEKVRGIPGAIEDDPIF